MRSVRQGMVQMRSVKVKRLDLLNKIRTNRDKHINEFKEAQEDYCLAMKDFLLEAQKSIEVLRNKLSEGEPIKIESLHAPVNPPVSHEKDYDAVISMLEMSVDDHIELKSDEHACYVMDDWDWKSDFEEHTRICKSGFLG